MSDSVVSEIKQVRFPTSQSEKQIVPIAYNPNK